MLGPDIRHFFMNKEFSALNGLKFGSLWELVKHLPGFFEREPRIIGTPDTLYRRGDFAVCFGEFVDGGGLDIAYE